MIVVSVIIPNYNHEKFLKERIDSVLNQTFQDFEIIIFDDASTDASLAILNSYKDTTKISHFIINETNSGSPFKQWNKGLKLAKGKYIWVAETDDFADDLFLEKTVAAIEKTKNVVLTYTDSKIIDEKGNYLGTFSSRKNEVFKTEKWSHSYFNNGLDETLDFLLYKVTINNISAVLFKKHFFQNIDFQKLEGFKNAGDLFTYISLCLEGDICYIPLPLNHYREHTHNITKKNIKNGLIYKERLVCFDFVVDYLNENNLSKIEKERVKKVLTYFMNKNIFNLLEFNYKKELNLFILKCKKQDFITSFQYNWYIVASKLYHFKSNTSKGLARRIIKKIVFD